MEKKRKKKKKLRCLEKHQSSETCLRKTEILMLTVKANSMEQRGAMKTKPLPDTMNPKQEFGSLVYIYR